MPGATLFLAVTPDMRPRIETAIDRLLAVLDMLDGDTDREFDDDLEDVDPLEDDDPAEDGDDDGGDPAFGDEPLFPDRDRGDRGATVVHLAELRRMHAQRGKGDTVSPFDGRAGR